MQCLPQVCDKGIVVGIDVRPERCLAEGGPALLSKAEYRALAMEFGLPVR